MQRAVLGAVFLLLLILVGYLLYEIKNLENGIKKELKSIKNDIENLKEDLNRIEGKISEEKLILANISTALENIEKELYSIRKEEYRYTTVNFVGLTKNGGVVLPIRIGVKEGDGSIYIRINGVSYDESFQETVKRAVIASKKFLEKKEKRSFEDLDVVVWVENPFMNPINIEGGSMGASISLGIISLIENRKIKEKTIITGGISSNGTILKVKKVREKAEVAKEYGIKRFIVPKGQWVNISGIEVVEVSRLEEAVEELLE